MTQDSSAGSPIGGGRRRSLRGVAEAATRLLPSPRDDALRWIGRDIVAFVRGREVKRPARKVVALDPAVLDEIRAQLDADRPAEALARIEEHLIAWPRHVRLLTLRRFALARLGELNASLDALADLRAVADEPALARLERETEARLVETDPRWLPWIPGPPRRDEPRPGVVLHLLKESVPHRQTGFTTRSRYMVLAQRDAGLTPVVVTQPGFPRSAGVEGAQAVEEVEGIRYHRLDPGGAYPSERPFDLALRDHAWLAARVARDERPAVIHAASGPRGADGALVGLALGAHLGVPVVYEMRSFFEGTWSSNADTIEHAEYTRRRWAAETRAMLAVDAVVTLSETMRREVIERGVREDRAMVVANGVDVELFAPRPRDPDLAARLGLTGRAVFGYLGNLDHAREGLELLVEATARLRARGRTVACLIVGDGERRAGLEALAAERGVTDAVVFTGQVPHAEVAALYAQFDVFVVPRRDDRAARFVTPLKPFEAMASGVPLVVSDLPALVEVAAPDERGLSFPAGDIDGLVAALERLLDDPALAARLGAAGQAWVAAERTWASNGRRYRDLYALIGVRLPDGEARHAD